jgi:sterol desaturase/sphingolipid hydroxylase (fatty acid hydroxylase superfamily)
LAAEYSHPIEFAFVNQLPFLSGLLLLGSKTHMFTFIIYGIFRVVETHESHSGYEIPAPISVLTGNVYRLIPFMGTSTKYHDFHHSRNVGNYSAFFTIWDTIFGLNYDFYRSNILNQKEKQKI